MSESPAPQEPVSPATPAPASAPAEAAQTVPELCLLHAARARHADVRDLLARAAGPDALADEELVHDLRVAARRLEEVLRLLRPLLDKPAAGAIGSSLKTLRRAMGALRDADVIRHQLTRARVPVPLKAIARSLAAGLERDRPALAAEAARAAASPSVQTAMLLLSQLLESRLQDPGAAEAEDRLRTTLRRLLKKRDRQLRKALGAAARSQKPEALHAARIAVKKLRYAAELAHLAELHPHLKTQLRTLKGLQQLLGDHHDAHVLAATLQAHLHDPALPHAKTPPAGAWRQWHGGLEKVQARRASEFFMKAYLWMNR